MQGQGWGLSPDQNKGRKHSGKNQGVLPTCFGHLGGAKKKCTPDRGGFGQIGFSLAEFPRLWSTKRGKRFSRFSLTGMRLRISDPRHKAKWLWLKKVEPKMLHRKVNGTED